MTILAIGILSTYAREMYSRLIQIKKGLPNEVERPQKCMRFNYYGLLGPSKKASDNQ